MQKIDTDKLDDLLDRTDLPALVETVAAAKPRRAGHGFHCACPLHQGDNTGAFSIFQGGDGRRWHWHCHTRCNEGGDALTFLRKYFNCDFVEAVKRLCQFTGTGYEDLGLTEQAIAEHKERDARRSVLGLAAQFYQAQLREHQPALDYLHGRAFTDETIARAGFGYSSGKGLGKWLKDNGGDVKLARSIGLLRGDGFDFTANAEGSAVSPEGWIIYTHRAGGRVDYFSARALNPDVEKGDKSRNLPGDKRLYRADVQGDTGLIIVEGQADAESWRQMGYTAWALCGTRLTDADVAAIRAHQKTFLGLDADDAGTERMAEIAALIGPLVMILPRFDDGHKDANEWLQSKPQASAAVVMMKHAKPYLAVFIAASEYIADYELEKRIDEIAALIAMLPDTMQGRWIKRAAAALDVPPADIKRRVKQTGPVETTYSLSEVRNGMLHFRGDALCNFEGHITHQLMLDDGANAPTIRYTIAAKLSDGKPLPPLELDSEEFETPQRWIAKHWGVDGILYQPPSQSYLIARAIKELSRSNGMKRETVRTFTGWTTHNGKRAFLTGSGAITEDGLDADARVELGHNRLAYYKLPAPLTSAQELRPAVKASLDFLNLADLKITAPLWACMYGAPLMELASLNAVVWVYGPTQSRKSTITMLALTHYGEQFIKGREYFAPRDWMSTITDLEGAMFVTKNLPMVIDDFAPQFTDINSSRDMHKKAHAVARSVGNRAARGRANADLSERAQRPPRGLVLSTAELPLTGQSIVGRTVYIPVQRGDVALSDGQSGPLDLAQKAAGPGSGLYAVSMSGYIHWLARNWEAVKDRVGIIYEASNQFARGQFPSTQSRLMDYYATLVTYSRVGLEYALSVGAIDKNRAQALGNELIPAALVELLQSQSARVAGQSPVVRLFEAVAEMLISRKAWLSPRTGAIPTPPHDALLIGWYGYDKKSERNVIYLRLGTAMSMAKEYWQRAGEGFDTTTDALTREIEQAKLLARRDEEQCAVSEWITAEKKNARVLAIDAARLPQECGIDIYPGPGPDGSMDDDGA
jgi:DNA primase